MISSPNLSANPVRAGTVCPDRTPTELSTEERMRSFWESTGSEVSWDTGPHAEGRSGRVKTARRPLGTSPFHSTQLSEDSRAHAHFPGLSGVYDFDQHGAAQVTLCDLPGGQKAMQLLPCFLDTHPRNPELPHQKPHPLRPPGCEETNPRGQPMERGLLASPVCMFPIQATGKCVHDPSGHLAPGQEWSPLRVPSRCCGASVNHLPALHRVPDA